LVFLGIQGRRLAFFRKPLPVLVAGGMNLDIQGRSFLPPVSGDSNPGTLRFAPGGAGRNMAENLVRLGASVEFLSVRGNDLAGHECAEKTAHAGVGMAGVRVLEGETSSCYLAILDDRGDMSLALAAMDIYERLDPGAVLETAGLVEQTSGLACFRGTSSQPFSALLVDGNLRPDTIESLIDRFPGVPVWFDPVSGAKARRFAEYCGGRLLSRISAMKPNDLELAVILDTLGSEAVSTTLPDTGSGGARVPSRAEKALMAARLLRDFGVGAVYVSLGAEGVAWDSGDSSGRYVPPAVETVSATGAGDALLATLAWSRVLGISPSEAVPLACAAATLTLGTTYACNPELSFSALLNHI
jgi:pseudouridine kinase